ncbi:MAG: hypothetical protein SPI12_01760 [Actinomycetaceae bacterium]|nr:hypothetical protein [Actinomycetaceae bacterium]MDY6082574.1 hypothetical protein [Actinomycetaceae bacterium]
MTSLTRKNASLVDASKVGKKAMLEAMRDMIARQLDEGVLARDLASLTKRLMEIEDELEAVIVEEEGDVIGEAAQIQPVAFTPSGGARTRSS